MKLFLSFIAGGVLVALALWQTWPTEPCAKVTAIVDQRVESLRAFEVKTIAEQQRYIASLAELLAFSRQANKELAASRDVAVRKLQELQPVSATLSSIEKDVRSIKILSAQRAPLEQFIKDEAKLAGPESFTMPWWKQQAVRLAQGRW